MKEQCPPINHRPVGIFSLTVLAWLFTLLPGFSQTSPPNDNYSNSITLTGTDITFSGTLAGATIEDSQETIATQYLLYLQPTQSVWWNWTAPDDMMLTLEIAGVSYPTGDALVVYNATNGSSSPAGLILPALGARETITGFSPQTLCVPVTAGSNYQIQLIGSSSANYTIRLQATKTPAIIQQPRSQAVDSNAAALFYVVYAGLGTTNFSFQWFLNGTNLPGETAPMLALTNIDSSMAGTYTVVVSNSAGITLSAPATLIVDQSNFPVSLSSRGFTNIPLIETPMGVYITNAFLVSAKGEIGRSYRFQSSTDLTNWVSETDFPTLPNGGPTSIFYQTNSAQVLTAPSPPGSKFFRIIPYVATTPHGEICINNLWQIRIAKMLWQRDYNPYATATPLTADIVPYLPHRMMPFCPDDIYQGLYATYTINNLEYDPACLITTNHLLEESR